MELPRTQKSQNSPAKEQSRRTPHLGFKAYHKAAVRKTAWPCGGFIDGGTSLRAQTWLWSSGFQQVPSLLSAEEMSLLLVEPGRLNLQVGKNELGPLPHTIYKAEFQLDQGPKSKS